MAKAANAALAVATGESIGWIERSAGGCIGRRGRRQGGTERSRSTGSLKSADGRLPRPRSVADGSSSDPTAASVATEAGGAAGSTVASLMHPPEGGPSEGTGHGSDRATGGTGFGPFGHPAKRWRAFSEACGRSRTVRRQMRRFDRAPTYGARFGLALGDFRKEPAARQGAGKPVDRFGGSSRWRSSAAALFGARAKERRNSTCRAFRLTPSAAGGTSGRRKA